MIKKALAFVILTVLAITAIAQKQLKPYSEWTEKEAQKILNDSPWAHTQVETDTSEMVFNPSRETPVLSNSSVGARVARGEENNIGGNRQVRGATNQATSVNYHIVFLSARPIREAISRKVELAQKTPNAELSAQLRGFVERNFADYIVVAVTFDTKDPRFANAPNQAFAGALLATIKNNTYLDRNDGKRLFLSQFIPPASDGLGAKFVFARNLDGKPFLTSEFSQVRFYSEVSRSVKLDQRFKISDMQYNGRLEY
jgi:hypothetical protein